MHSVKRALTARYASIRLETQDQNCKLSALWDNLHELSRIPLYLPIETSRPTSLKRRLIRPLSLRRQPRKMPPLPILPVKNSTMRRNTVVPHNDRTGRPLHAHLQIGAEGDVVVEEFEEVVTFFFLETDDAAGELRGSLVSIRMGQGAGVVVLTGWRLTCGLTKIAFSPVAGWVRTTGWTVLMGSRRTIEPRARALAACSWPEWTAFRPWRRFRNSGERRW